MEFLKQLKPGTIVGVGYLLYTHVGIISDRKDDQQLPMIISNSNRIGGVKEETWQEFAQGRDIRVVGYPSNRPPQQVLEEARKFIDSTQYNPVLNNCEHFCAHVHGLPHRSPQIIRALKVAGVIGAATITAVALPILRNRIFGRRI